MPSVFPDKSPLSPASLEAPSASQSSLLGAATPPAVGAVRGQGAFYSVTHGPAGTSAEAGHHRQDTRTGTGWVASLLHRLSVAFRGRDSSPAIAGEVAGDRASIIGRRAERLNNRNRAAAGRYVEVHSILARGRA